MTRKCKAGKEEKTHQAQELGDGLRGRLDVGEIGLGVGSGNGLGYCWAVGSRWAMVSQWAMVFCKKPVDFWFHVSWVFGFICHLWYILVWVNVFCKLKEADVSCSGWWA
jgi:hypothetical protein